MKLTLHYNSIYVKPPLQLPLDHYPFSPLIFCTYLTYFQRLIQKSQILFPEFLQFNFLEISF